MYCRSEFICPQGRVVRVIASVLFLSPWVSDLDELDSATASAEFSATNGCVGMTTGNSGIVGLIMAAAEMRSSCHNIFVDVVSLDQVEKFIVRKASVVKDLVW